MWVMDRLRRGRLTLGVGGLVLWVVSRLGPGEGFVGMVDGGGCGGVCWNPVGRLERNELFRA